MTTTRGARALPLAFSTALFVAACGASPSPSGTGTAGVGAAGANGPGGAGVGAAGAGAAGTGVAGGAAGEDGPAGVGGGAGATSPADAGVAGAGVAGASGGPEAGTDAPTPHDGPVLTGTVKIMVLGSSNEVITCWRALLQQKLRAAGVTNFDFVGSQSDGPDCGTGAYDKDDESHSGLVISNVPASTFLDEFKAHPPQIVLQHFGGADILDNLPIDPIIATYTTVVAQARMVNPDVIFLAAQHTPETATGCNDCIANVMKLNAAMVPWAAATTTDASPVSLVDLFTGLVTATDFSDGVHLNMAGSDKVADRWLAALLPLLKP
jgi:hypothetical protein